MQTHVLTVVNLDKSWRYPIETVVRDGMDAFRKIIRKQLELKKIQRLKEKNTRIKTNTQ